MSLGFRSMRVALSAAAMLVAAGIGAQAGETGGNDIFEWQVLVSCPAEITIDGSPVAYCGRGQKVLPLGEIRGKTLTLKGPWRRNCHGVGDATIRQDSLLIPISDAPSYNSFTFTDPCGGKATHRVVANLTSTANGANGRKFSLWVGIQLQ